VLGAAVFPRCERSHGRIAGVVAQQRAVEEGDESNQPRALGESLGGKRGRKKDAHRGRLRQAICREFAAPRVGLEPTTLRLTGQGNRISCAPWHGFKPFEVRSGLWVRASRVESPVESFAASRPARARTSGHARDTVIAAKAAATHLWKRAAIHTLKSWLIVLPAAARITSSVSTGSPGAATPGPAGPLWAQQKFARIACDAQTPSFHRTAYARPHRGYGRG